MLFYDIGSEPHIHIGVQPGATLAAPELDGNVRVTLRILL